MSIQTAPFDEARRTSADDVFERLRSDIVNLRLEPGTKLSEVEIAKQNEVSRQPVREAFIRLNNMKLLRVRPQKATLVRKISIREILNTRFIRTAVEIEVVRHACACANAVNLFNIEENLSKQNKAIREKSGVQFHDLDYEFHRLLCLAANCEFAFKSISENKSQTDRLCMLSLANDEEREELYSDHSSIFDALKNRDESQVVKLTRSHLGRLDSTFTNARESHPEYFED